jgi:hypothetical protein
LEGFTGGFQLRNLILERINLLIRFDLFLDHPIKAVLKEYIPADKTKAVHKMGVALVGKLHIGFSREESCGMIALALRVARVTIHFSFCVFRRKQSGIGPAAPQGTGGLDSLSGLSSPEESLCFSSAICFLRIPFGLAVGLTMVTKTMQQAKEE